jgi:hypothetical protein
LNILYAFGLLIWEIEFTQRQIRKKTYWISLIALVSTQVASFISISFLSKGKQEAALELTEIIGTNPVLPLPIYIFSGIAIAFTIISACILIAKRFEHSSII